MSKEKSGTLLLHSLRHINARTCSGGFSEQSESVSVGGSRLRGVGGS